MYLMADQQLSFKPGYSILIQRKIQAEDNVSHPLDAVVFSYVCSLKFLFQLDDCMRKSCIFNTAKNKIKFGKFDASLHQKALSLSVAAVSRYRHHTP